MRRIGASMSGIGTASTSGSGVNVRYRSVTFTHRRLARGRSSLTKPERRRAQSQGGTRTIMDRNEMRADDMLRRVRDFGASRTIDFPPDSLGRQMFAEVTAVVTELARQATVQAASAGSASVSSAARARLRASLRGDLRHICRTAGVVLAGQPDLKKRFRLPESGDVRWLAAARAIAEAAEPLVAEFIQHEMPADFLVKLRSDIAAFESAVHDQNQTREARTTATSSLGTLRMRGMKAMRHLDVTVRNKYRNDTASLAAWKSASHIERRNGRSRGVQIGRAHV